PTLVVLARRTEFAILTRWRTHGNEEDQRGLSICQGASARRGGRYTVSRLCNHRRETHYLDAHRHRAASLRTLQSHSTPHTLATESVPDSGEGGAVRQTVKTSSCAHVQAHSTFDGALFCHS